MTASPAAPTFRFLWFVALWAWLIPPLHAQARFAAPEPDIERLVALIDQRLALMPDVAASKWRAEQPIVDEAREQAVLERSVADATALQLDGDGARQFFAVQIRMARAVQSACFERWRATPGSTVPAGRDLNSDLRPQLDALGRDLLKAAYLTSGAWASGNESTRLAKLRRHVGINDDLVNELAAALRALQIKGAPSWDAIRQVGVLRIGTTGDYAPFSAERNGVLAGFDIWLAESLARHLGIQVRFVRTSWPTLMQDFRAHRFDLGMSGISVTDERRMFAEFSTAYHVDGKAPIARCGEASRYRTLAQIDRPGVRVIANPGGTNEQFARTRLKRATLIMHPDNLTVFEELLAGRADVMITDAIEVELQALRHPDLCGTTSAPLTRAEKAIMLSKSPDLKSRIDEWLAAQKVSGQLKEQLRLAVSQAR